MSSPHLRIEWKNTLKDGDITKIKNMIEKDKESFNYYCSIDYAGTDEAKNFIINYYKDKECIMNPSKYIFNGKQPFYGNKNYFAVVQWHNYRKTQFADCLAIFKNFDDAKMYSYKRAYLKIINSIFDYNIKISNKDYKKLIKILNKGVITSKLSSEDQEIIKNLSDKYDKTFYIISENEITDINGPGCSNYDTLISFCNSDDGYDCTFYCVVNYFKGVENSWNCYWGTTYINGTWSPSYNYEYDDEFAKIETEDRAATIIQRGCHDWLWCPKCKDGTMGLMVQRMLKNIKI